MMDSLMSIFGLPECLQETPPTRIYVVGTLKPRQWSRAATTRVAKVRNPLYDLNRAMPFYGKRSQETVIRYINDNNTLGQEEM